MTGEQKPGGLSTTATNTMRSLDALCRIPSSSPAEPAEARIRELEARVAELLRESTAIAEGRRFQRDRATAAEAKLARAVEGLRRIGYGDGGIGTYRGIAQQTLAALKSTAAK